ncbi:hypothetical protein OROGR_029325 [Orobanche gracilis]
MAYIVVFIKLIYLCLVIVVLLLLLMSFLIFSSSCPINVNCEFRTVGHKFTRSGWGFVSAKQSKVAGDEFLIKYWDIENVNLLTTTNANGGLMAIYNKITRSRCFAFVTVNNSGSRCSSSSWLSGSFYNTETESSLGVDTMVLFQLVMEMENTSIDIMYHTGHQTIRSFLLSGLNLSHPLTDQQLASGSSLGHSFQQAEDALTGNGKTSADFDPMCY